MSATQIEVRELPGRIREAMDLLSAGAEVILTEETVPCARLAPLPPGPPRRAGLHPGAMQASPDFDAPLPDGFWLGEP